MNKIVQNPVHPFDLSLSNLILIYKKFEQAKRISNNPNQELLVDVIVQLVARLINHDPSKLQKSLTNALYKNTISWNEFLNFLDKQSEARQNILNWIMYEMNIKQFKFNKNIDLHFLGSFEEITYFQTVQFQGKIYYTLILDSFKLIIFEKDSCKVSGTFCRKRIKNQFKKQLFEKDQKIDKIQKREKIDRSEKSEKSNKGKEDNEDKDDKSDKGTVRISTALQKAITNMQKQIRKGYRSKQLTNQKHTESIEFSPKLVKFSKNSLKKQQKGINHEKSMMEQSQNINIIDNQTYYRRQRKKINSAFQIFKQLPIQQSGNLVEYLNSKISSRKIHDVNLSELRSSYAEKLHKKTQIQRSPNMREQKDHQADKIKQYLKNFYQDKKKFSYNPYRLDLKKNNRQNFRYSFQKKKINFEKKEKENYFTIRTLCYLQQYHLFAIVLYSFQILLIRIKKQFNKVVFEEQHILKVPKDEQNKKKDDSKRNQIIQQLNFHYHEITNKYQLLVLVRGQGYSCVRCFNLIMTEIGQKKITQYTFSLSKQIFNIMINFEAILMITQKNFGFHVIASCFHMISYKDDWNQNNQYYKGDPPQKFKSDIKFSCFDVSSEKKKMVFGTVGGSVLFFDTLTKQIISTKKISCKNIIKVKFIDVYHQIYILSADEIVTIYDSNKLQQIQILRVKNQDRLNQKITMFSYSFSGNQTILHCFGSEVRQFISFVDQQKNNRKRKIECTYKWRLQKIKSPAVQDLKKSFFNDKHDKHDKHEKQSNLQQIIGVVMTEKYFIVLSKKNEIKLISKKSYKIKYELVIGLTIDQNIIAFNVSKDSKMIVFSLENQKIKALNIHTEEIYQVFDIKQKITHIQFLSQRNQYFIVTGSETGKITFVPSNSAKLLDKVTNAHNKAITALLILEEILITTSQDSKFIIWQLPYNVIKYTLSFKERLSKQYILQISPGKNIYKLFCRGYSGLIYEIDAKNGQIKETYDQLSPINILCFYYNNQTKQLVIIDQNLNLNIYQYIQDKLNNHLSADKKFDLSTRKYGRKQSKIQKVKSGTPTNGNNNITNKWRLKFTHYIREKDVDFVVTFPNLITKQVLFFFSKSGFYIYDEIQQQIKQKQFYCQGILKYDNVITPDKKRAISAAK